MSPAQFLFIKPQDLVKAFLKSGLAFSGNTIFFPSGSIYKIGLFAV